MRLIDADKLKIRNVSADYWYKVMGVTEENIDDADTVDAIPKQWLRELQTRYLKEDCLMSVGIVNEIMNLWDYEKDKWEKEVDE